MARGWQGWTAGLGLLTVAISWTGSAEAEEKARLVYVRSVGAQECPPEVDLRLLVMARLGYDPFSPQASRVVLSRIDASGEKLVGSLEVVDQSGMATGQRELTAKVGNCADLARALALSISLAIDPERASLPPPAPAAPAAAAASEPPTPQPQPKPLLPAKPSTQPMAQPHAFVGVALAASAGALPAAALGGVLSLGWNFGFGSVALEGLTQQALPRELSPRGNLTGRLLGGGLSACWVGGPWAACGLAVAGAQRLATSGVTHPVSNDGLFLGAGPRLAWALSLSRRWQLVISLEGLVNLQRNGAELSGKEVWRTPPASATLSLGLRANFL